MTGAVSIGWCRSCSGRPPVEGREELSQARGNKTSRRKSAQQPHSGFRVAGKGDTETRMRLSNVARAILPVVAHGLEGRATGGMGILPVVAHGLEGRATTLRDLRPQVGGRRLGVHAGQSQRKRIISPTEGKGSFVVAVSDPTS